MTVSDLPLWFWRSFGFVFGLLWGSFLNVVIYRLPRDMNVAHPPSHCPGCGKPIAPYDNIPVVSFVVLRGRARCCGAKMSPRYVIVEIIGGVLAWALVEVVIRKLPGDMSLLRGGMIYLAYFGLAMGLLAAAFIDAEHMILPDSITLGGTVLGIATASLRGFGIVASLVSAVGSYLVLWGFGALYKLLRKRQGLGLGDVKLIMLAGAWFGLEGALFAVMAGSVQGTLYALVSFVFVGKLQEPEAVTAEREQLKELAAQGDEEAKTALEEDFVLAEAPSGGLSMARIPFGPFLILGILEYLFFHTQLSRLYWRWLAIG